MFYLSIVLTSILEVALIGSIIMTGITIFITLNHIPVILNMRVCGILVQFEVSKEGTAFAFTTKQVNA